jgi:hypothetical protein
MVSDTKTLCVCAFFCIVYFILFDMEGTVIDWVLFVLRVSIPFIVCCVYLWTELKEEDDLMIFILTEKL